MEYKNVGKLIRECRGPKSQAQFAKDLNISQAFLSDIENNKKEPGKKLALLLSTISGRPIESFFNF